MTERCSAALQECVPTGVALEVSVVAQGAARPIESNGVRTFLPKNLGFAGGMNRAIEEGLRYFKAPDYILCFNNDLEFPNKGWLRHLVDIAEQTTQVLCPATDSAAHRTQSGPEEKPSFSVENNSAYCWLVPMKWCRFLKATYGFWLFDEDFAPAYGEDDWTAFLLAKHFGPKHMRYVPRSFVKHLRARTARTVEHNRRDSGRTLVKKLQAELRDEKLPSYLKRWAQNYISILSTRQS